MKIGIIKEGKIPSDERVPLSPKQCKEINDNFPSINIVVQSSDVRRFKDEEYLNEGIKVVDSVADCDILMGVKEVPISQLIPNKTYFYFSHTIKKQPHNRNLLRSMLEKNITMIDYEGLTKPNGVRLIGFGKYAGIVGSYNTFYAYGKKAGSFDLKRAYLCEDQTEMENELHKIKLPANFKIIITGGGRVASGTIQILDQLKIKKVSPSELIDKTYNEPVYSQLMVTDYYKRIDEKNWIDTDFFKNPSGYESNFMKFAKIADMYISCHFWDAKAPHIIAKENIKSTAFNVKTIGDISCDINGPIASTIRSSTIDAPIYGYDPQTEKEVSFENNNSITVMAVDNLPCELPKDASANFGREFIDKILPHLINDKEDIIKRATICENGSLTEQYKYLNEYVKGEN